MDNAQKLALRTHIQANTTQLAFGGGTAAINATFGGESLNAGDAKIIADWYNLPAAPDYWVVRPDAPFVDVRNNILGARYTPAPAITSGNAAQHTAASNACMGKLALLGFLLPPGAFGAFDATKALQVASMKDALTGLPSAGSFNLQDAGWVPGNGSGGVANVLVRRCTNLEKVFVLGQSVAALTIGTPAFGSWDTNVAANCRPDITALYGATVDGNAISDIKGLPA